MADLVFTWDETIHVFGLEQTNNWGSMLWGENWGDGPEIFKDIGKVLEEDIGSSDEVEFALGINFTFDESVGATDALEDLTITDSKGYTQVFLDTTDAAAAAMTTYSEASAAGSSYTKVTNPSTTWTET